MTRRSGPKRALILSGGGARGAYEAGVLNYLLSDLQPRLGRPLPIDIVSGTSIGAVHACYLAATAGAAEGGDAGRRIASIWTELRFEQLFGRFGSDLLQLPLRLATWFRLPWDLRHRQLPPRLYGLIDTGALERLVVRTVAWRRIRANLAAGNPSTLCVAATEIASGRVAVFTEGADVDRIRWADSSDTYGYPVRIGLEHALASAAIPILFPAVRIGDGYFCDGGMRMNTPLSPALRAGADRALVISLRHAPPNRAARPVTVSDVAHLANPAVLVGRLLNAMMLDSLDADLARLERINDILRRGARAYGPEFFERIDPAGDGGRAQRYRVVDTLTIRPSHNLGALASSVLSASHAVSGAPAVLRVLLRALGADPTSPESDLISYLYFDAAYAKELTRLGYDDARAMEDELFRFFSD